MHTFEPVSRSFSHGGYLELNINITDSNFGISNSSLVWYHNGTELFSGDRHTITNDNTRLIIRDMRSHDAGVYKVNFTYTCPYPLPSLALFAPVTFTVQENSPPTYNPLSMIPAHYVSAEDPNSTIVLDISTDTQYFIPLGAYWYRNGSQLRNTGSTISLSLYTNSDDISGIYFGLIEVMYRYQPVINEDYCVIGSSYFHLVIPIGLSLWNISKLQVWQVASYDVIF